MGLFRSTLFRHSIIYTLSGSLVKAVPFLLLPVLTRFLSPSEYGLLAIYQIAFQIGMVLVGLRTHGALAVNYYQLEERHIWKYSGTLMYIIICTFFPVFAIVLILEPILSSLTGLPILWIEAAVVAAAGQSIALLTLTLFQVQKRPKDFAIFQISQMSLNIMISLFLVIEMGLGWKGRISGIVFANLTFGFLAVLILKRLGLNMKFDRGYTKDALAFGVPLLPAALGRWMMTGTDRLFINSMIGIKETGLYAAGYQVGMVVYLLADSFNKAWFPFLFENLKENEEKLRVRIVRFTYIYFAFILFVAWLIGLGAPHIISLVLGEGYEESAQFVFWIAFGYAGVAMFLMVVNYIAYVKKTYILAWITFSCGLLNVGLNYVLVRLNGAVGAAQATTLCYFISFFLTWFLSMRVCPMPWFDFLRSK